jgi:hypothetical protein
MIPISDILSASIAFLGLAVAIATPVVSLAYLTRIFETVALAD